MTPSVNPVPVEPSQLLNDFSKSDKRALRLGILTGNSYAMQKVYRVIEHVADRTCPVLILGESGTGKELVARAIHNSGSRAHETFVSVDCSAVTPSLFETEMFGCVKGAYTGAFIDRTGLMESANGGTLFLDEVGNLPLELQVKLLRVLQQHEIRKVGANTLRPFTGRIIAATNEDIVAGVKNHKFRADLFYRLNVIQITVPPLRDRREDIHPLAEAFVQDYDETGQRHTISIQALEKLESYSWPGNVRELQNVVARTVALEDGAVLQFDDFNPAFTTLLKTASTTLASLKRELILDTLRNSGNDKAIAARKLGIGKTTLYRQLKQYKTEPSTSPSNPTGLPGQFR
jgi:DNA-binding NtrC family response regulator